VSELRSRNPETLIALSAKLKDAISNAIESYESLPPILDQELKAIKLGKLADAESILYTKETLASKIENSFEIMASLSEEIWRMTGKKPQNLTELINFFNVEDHEKTLAYQVLSYQFTNIKIVADQLIEIARKVKPLIESNKILVTKLQDNYNKSYKFWQEIKEEVEGSYSADGSKKIVGRHHGFSVRA
jgi:flagellar biosynthesis/type III secretory pathway chaperone